MVQSSGPPSPGIENGWEIFTCGQQQMLYNATYRYFDVYSCGYYEGINAKKKPENISYWEPPSFAIKNSTEFFTCGHHKTLYNTTGYYNNYEVYTCGYYEGTRAGKFKPTSSAKKLTSNFGLSSLILCFLIVLPYSVA